MNNDKQYGVLHEIGDYYQPKKLDEEDNKAINEQMKKTADDNKDDDKK